MTPIPIRRFVALLFATLCLAACGGGGGSSDAAKIESYAVDAERTFTLYDLDQGAPGAEREALARANAQALALADDPSFRLELAPDGTFRFRLSQNEEARGTWTRTEDVITLETTSLEGESASGTTDATVVEDGLLRIEVEKTGIYLRRMP
ncbi:MAG: hypothetical protein QNJ98_13825 [Planctomycetota bacterium]|nr:hypothetical protein [Planctomycetota bacterium]